MSERYSVRLDKEYHVFSAAHFITFAGNICERLHGHNYRVSAELSGPLDENYYVIDFILLRDALKTIVDELDHHMLLPTGHPTITVKLNEVESEYLVTFEDRRWIFPQGDCLQLPVENTTAELIARYIGGRLLSDIADKTNLPQEMKIGVDENNGQWGVYHWRS